MTKDWEDDYRSNERRGKVETGDDACVDVDLVVEFVVGSEHDEAAPGDAEGEEHLFGRLAPYGEVEQLLPLGDEQELKAVNSTLQQHSVNQQCDQDEVGERRCEVDNL